MATTTPYGSYQRYELHLGAINSSNLTRPELLGLVKPVVGPDGKLAAEGLLPPDVNGAYLMLVTLQAHGMVNAPGKTVLGSYVAL
jgi:hypothetical protein